MSTASAVTFAAYLVFLLAVGFYFYRRSRDIEDYLLGGRGMGAWVTALSAQASDMSGWLLMGLPGAVYMAGVSTSWIATGLLAGTVLNWVFVAGRLRVYTEKTESITLPCFFERRFRDPTGLVRTVSAIIILIFFTIYASSGMVASGRLFESVFGMRYEYAVLAGGVIIVGYTFLGGFLAVCWTDLFQGLLMLLALVVVPVVALKAAGGVAGIREAMEAREISFGFVPRDAKYPVLAIISAMGWGMGYFGQPHILARFMSAKSVAKIKESTVIAFVWVLLSLSGAVVAGLVGIGMFEGLSKAEADKVFIYMIDELFNPWVGGVLLAAILSAIMSTIDSQLLVWSSALTEDFYVKVVRKDASERRVMLVGRAGVIIISVIAMALAMNADRTIMEIVEYAWGGFGAAFGPVVLFALFWKKATWQGVLAGMATGTVVMVVWEQTQLSEYMYELVPGFVANCVMLVVVSGIAGQRDPAIIEEYVEVRRGVRGEAINGREL